MNDLGAQVRREFEEALKKARLDPVDITTRYLLIELPFDGSSDPDSGEPISPVGNIAEAIGTLLDGDPLLVDVATISQVYPGDVVAPSTVADAFDLNVRAALREAGAYGQFAFAALEDEREGDFKRSVANLLNIVTRLNNFAQGM